LDCLAPSKKAYKFLKPPLTQNKNDGLSEFPKLRHPVEKIDCTIVGGGSLVRLYDKMMNYIDGR